MDEVMIQYNEIDTELHQTSVLILLIGISHEIEKHRLEASILKPKMSCSKSVMSDISNIVDISAFHCNRFFFIGSFLYRRVASSVDMAQKSQNTYLVSWFRNWFELNFAFWDNKLIINKIIIKKNIIIMNTVIILDSSTIKSINIYTLSSSWVKSIKLLSRKSW